MLGFLWRLGFRRGVLGASRGWAAVFALTALVRVLRWLRDREDPVVFCEELEPDETLVIAHRREVAGRGER